MNGRAGKQHTSIIMNVVCNIMTKDQRRLLSLDWFPIKRFESRLPRSSKSRWKMERLAATETNISLGSWWRPKTEPKEREDRTNTTTNEWSCWENNTYLLQLPLLLEFRSFTMKLFSILHQMNGNVHTLCLHTWIFLDPSLGLILVMISRERFKRISSDLAQTSTFLSIVDDDFNRIIPKCLTG